MRIFKKITSILIASCLMIGIANIPVYAKATAISTTKTTDAVLSKAYTTPAQAAKKASNKTTATKTNSTKKANNKSVNKVVNQTISLINKLLKK